MRREDWEHWGKWSFDSCTFIYHCWRIHRVVGSTDLGFTCWSPASFGGNTRLLAWIFFPALSPCFCTSGTPVILTLPFGHVPLACYALLCFPFLFLFVLHLEIFCPPVFEFITSLFCCVQSSVNAIHWVLNFRCYILQLENLYLIFLIDFNLCWNSPFYSFWPTFSSTFSSKAFEC